MSRNSQRITVPRWTRVLFVVLIIGGYAGTVTYVYHQSLYRYYLPFPSEQEIRSRHISDDSMERLIARGRRINTDPSYRRRYEGQMRAKALSYGLNVALLYSFVFWPFVMLLYGSIRWIILKYREGEIPTA